ncbi:hypothetical protein PNOK_0112300 [Pyrrhoderma noxium]|uniref:Epidermal growth factor receptor-like transmembrane-juxtamembrane segment domain-containing protein n=1 Tax=Pyrrhoderma noxium TaxID=2282107 RepID=A0A286UX68_9AGAM|nr:hypothetical protein PNOK_0112300 [Pyrrhoderma noxium]
MSYAQFKAAFIALALISFDAAQAQITSNATCLSSWSGLYNSKGQSPCLVAAYLAGACTGGEYDVNALNAGEHYIGPSSSTATNCLCSSVLYNVMGGCSTCQNGTIITWSNWDSACPQIYLKVFPEEIPEDTAVPGWAYEDPADTNNVFNPTSALADSSPESTGTLVQETRTASGSGSSSTSTNSSSSAAGGSSKSKAGAIAGGVVGGIAGVSLLGLLVFFLIRRSKKSKANKTTVANVGSAGADLNGGNGYPGSNVNSPLMAQHDISYSPLSHSQQGYDSSLAATTGGAMPTPRLYDPNDPSTFPSALDQQYTGQSYVPASPYPIPGNQNSDGAVSPAHTGPSGNHGMYRGVAEV